MQQNIAACSINLQKENNKRGKKIIIEKLIEGLKKKKMQGPLTPRI